MRTFLPILIVTVFATSLSLAQVGTPADAGLTPRTPTIDVNTNYNNNNLETGGTVITANTNVVVGWEDDFSAADVQYWGATFTVYDRNGNLLTPNAAISSLNLGGDCPIVGGPFTTTYRSFYRADGSATPSYAAWGAKVKANLFGNGFGIGGSADAIACEVTQLTAIQVDDSGAGDFPAVQFLNNDGSRDATVGGPDVAGIASYADADAQAAGGIRMGDWERLANGNIVIVGEDRDGLDLVTKFGGSTARRCATYKVLNSTGGVVKALSLASSSNEDRVEMWHGAAVTANGFAIRFSVTNPEGSGAGVKIRFFDNNGNPTSTNIDLATLAGHPEAGGGGRGDSVGFTGNGKDAYVNACPSAVGPWVTVINANGSLRYSRRLADDDLATGGGSDRMGAGISEDGRVVVAFQAANNDTNNVNLYGLPQARLFDPSGNPIGPVFYLSERETPANALASNGGDGRPRVAFRGNTIAAMWGSLNSPVTANTVLALRVFDVASHTPQVGTPADAGLTPRTPTIDVNTNYNNNNLETGGTVITANTNVVVGWEDDFSAADVQYWGATFTVYDRNGNLLTPNAAISSLNLGGDCPIVGGPITTTYRSFYRADGSATPSYAAWGAKVKANLFGNGFGIGGSADAIACEVTQLTAIQVDDSGAGDFPAVQFLNNDGSRDATVGGPDVAGIASYADADAQAAGGIRMGDWERLANGNIVIVGEDRDGLDLVTKFGGSTARRCATYKVLNSTGGVVKALSLASSSNEDRVEMWHGAAVTANGFAIRFSVTNPEGSGAGVKIRFFDNNGNPTSTNIDLATLAGHPEAGGGGRGDSVGFTGNGKDAYVNACPSAVGPWVTVINANGSLRYSRRLADDDLATGGGSDRMGAGISEDGRVVVAFQAANNDTNNVNLYGLPQARLFDPCGNPIGPVFYLSERETPANALASNGGDGRPRVAFRGNTIAAMWGSLNSPVTANTVLALRVFDVAPYTLPSLSISQSGTNVVICWPASFGNLTLQSSPTISASAWTAVSPQPAIVTAGGQNCMTVPVGTGNLFFRVAVCQ